MDDREIGMESPQRGTRFEGHRHAWLVASIGLIGALVSVSLFHLSREREQRVFQAEFQQRAQERMMAIEREITTAVVIVRSLAAYHGASDAVSRAQFHSFTESMLARHPTLISLSFNAYVSGEQREAFEASVSREGIAEYQITERDASGSLVRAGDRADYVAVKYIEPLEQNRKAVGFDVSSEPVRREALNRARNTGRLAATGRIKLVQGNGSQNAVLILGPVFDDKTTTDSLSQVDLEGFVVGVFRIGDLVDRALTDLTPVGIEIALTDESAPKEAQLLHLQTARNRSDATDEESRSAETISASKTLEVGGRRWRIHCRPSEAYLLGAYTWAPIVISGTVLTITSLMITYLLLLNRVNRRLKKEITGHKLTLLAQQRVEQQLRLFNRVIESAINGVVITDALKDDNPVIYVNRAFERISGYDAEEIIGRNCRVLQGQDRDQPALEELRRAIADAREVRVVLRNYRKDGTLFWNELFLSPVRDVSGALTHFVSTQNDITDRKRAEEARQQLEAKFQQTQKLESLGVMAGGIAHDFNNLLTPIVGYCGLALSKLTPQSTVRQDVQQIEKASLRAAELIKQMLAYSGRGKILKTRFNLSQLIEEMGQLLHTVSSSVNVHYELASYLPDVEGDANQIGQVVMNLITNASEAVAHDGLVSIRTGVMMADRDFLANTYVDDHLPEGSYAFVEISDTGCGMSQETLASIFDPFFTTKFTGRGLGLAAVLGIVRGHQGAIRIDSKQDEGTTVIVLLPHTGTRTIVSEPNDSPEEFAAELFWGTVLVVDDEEIVRTVSRKMLEKIGFYVLTASDGVKAVEIFAQHKGEIAVVLLDLTMPNVGGEEVFRQIRRLRADVPIILSSGYSEQELEARFIHQGFSGFLQKPYSLTCLTSKLHAVLSVGQKAASWTQ